MEQISIEIKYRIGDTVQWRIDGIEHKGKVEGVRAEITASFGILGMVDPVPSYSYIKKVVYTVFEFANWKTVQVDQVHTHELRIITFKNPDKK